MIKVKLYNHVDYFGERYREFRPYSDSCLEHIMDENYEEGIIPFSDSESIGLLKTLGINLIGNDRFSEGEGRSHSVYELGSFVKYALAVISYSKQRKFVGFQNISEIIWQYLAELQLTVLIAMDIQEYNVYYFPFEEETEYTIINYPYQGKELEVNVKKCREWDEKIYVPVISERKHNSSESLVIDREGKYYNSPLGVHHALRYYWKNDIENIINYIEKRKYNSDYLINIAKEYDYVSFLKAIHATHFLQNKDDLQIICHLRVCPQEINSRKLPYLFVTKHIDGNYKIHGGLTYKFPEFYEIFEDILERKDTNESEELSVLVVDVEELLDSVQDMEDVICGFRVKKNCIEIFDKDEALSMFGNALKEAYYSGKCTISDEFY